MTNVAARQDDDRPADVIDVLPVGATRAFYVSTADFGTGTPTPRHALALPTFAPADVTWQSLDVHSRLLYALAFTAPATNRVLDGAGTVVFVMPDGTIVNPDCPATDCTPARYPQAYAELQAMLAG